MASTANPPGFFKTTFAGILIIVGLFAFVYFTRGMLDRRPTASMNQGGRPERVKALADVRDQTSAALVNFGALDTNRGIYRLSIDRAMEMVAQAKDAGRVRADLIARAAKAAEPLPEKPQAPSEYE